MAWDHPASQTAKIFQTRVRLSDFTLRGRIAAVDISNIFGIAAGTILSQGSPKNPGFYKNENENFIFVKMKKNENQKN